MFIHLHRERDLVASVKNLRGQSDLMSVMILIGAVLIIGVTFAGLTLANVSNFTSVNQVKTILGEDQSSIVLYVERGNETHICFGVLRSIPDYRVYAFALVSSDYKEDLSSALTIPIPGVAAPTSFDARRMHYLYQGEYYEFTFKGSINVLALTDKGVRDYIMQRKPLLVCIDKTILAGTSAYFLVFSYINNELYEVREWYVTG
jgi:hypothetical protein